MVEPASTYKSNLHESVSFEVIRTLKEDSTSLTIPLASAVVCRFVTLQRLLTTKCFITLRERAQDKTQETYLPDY